jgi:poly(hydroxyalkanoate) depolymerase family esterase
MAHHQNSDGLSELTGFGANPGALRGWLYLPDLLARKTPLVVVLHGCTQTAAGYGRGSGWIKLAEQKGFALLFPEQQRSNNANGCFNWFEPADIGRDAGEAQSIAEMIRHVVEAHGLDARRVFITGLSAGGAMANTMLAAYPDLFAGGAIIGGLPHGTATGVAQAFERMQGRNPPTTAKLHSDLKTVSRHTNGLPPISIWHGTHDQTVRPINADQIAEQWRWAHATAAAPSVEETIHGHVRQAWMDKDGKQVVELYRIKGMAHGVPLATGATESLGAAGPFMLEAGISSTARIAAGWGLADASDVEAAELVDEAVPATPPSDFDEVIAKAMAYAKPKRAATKAPPSVHDGVGKVITDALRAAGLMK